MNNWSTTIKKNKEKLIQEINDICRHYDDIIDIENHDDSLFNEILIKCLYNHTSITTLKRLKQISKEKLNDLSK